MKKIFYILTLLAFNNSFAQPAFEWSFFAGGTATSEILKTDLDSNSDIFGLGVFYSGDMILDGTTYSPDVTITNHFVIKVSATGDILWVHPGFHNAHHIVSNGTDVFVSAQDTIYRLDGSSGSVVWKSPFQVAMGTIYPSIPLELMSDGNLVFSLQYEGEDLTMAGDTTDDPNYSAFIVLGKMQASNGQVLWKNQFEYPSMIALVSHCELLTDDLDNIYMLTDVDSMGNMTLNNGVIAEFDPSLQSRGDFIAKFDSNGLAQWSRTIAGPDTVQVFTSSFSLSPDQSELYIAGGYIHSYYPAPSVGFEFAGMNIVQYCTLGSGQRNFYAKLSTGNVGLANLSLDNCYSNMGSYAYENTLGDYYLIGKFKDSLFINSDTLINYNTEFLSYLAKFDSLNNLIYSYELPNGLISANNNDLEFFPGGPLLIAGTAYDSTRSSHPTFFIGKTISSAGTEEIDSKSVVKAFPNPTNGTITIENGEEMIGGNISVFDITGRMVTTVPIVSKTTHFDMAGLTPGIYIVSLHNSSVIKNIRVSVCK